MTKNDQLCQLNQEKCDKSRLVTTSAPKHFIPKVAYFYPKSGVVLGARTYNIEERGERSEERDMLYALLNSPPFGGVGGGCYYSLTPNP